MKIRKFEEVDRESIIALWKACELTRPWNDPNKDIDRKVQYQPDMFFVGEVNSQVVASAMAGYDGHRGSVFYLAVSPIEQGYSVGFQVMLRSLHLLSLDVMQYRVILKRLKLMLLSTLGAPLMLLTPFIKRSIHKLEEQYENDPKSLPEEICESNYFTRLTDQAH
jgi:hypothetical protein